MTVTAWDFAALTTVDDNMPETLVRRLRAHLQALAILRLANTYRGLPAPGFFACAARLGRFAGDATGPDALLRE